MHDLLLNKIGNLALIKGDWNISMSNQVYAEKIKQYINSEIGPTKELVPIPAWTFDGIIDRTKRLADRALEIWKFGKAIPDTILITEDIKAKSKRYLIGDDIELFCQGPFADAKANVIDHSIVRVRKGSYARLKVSMNFTKNNYSKLRDSLVSEEILVEEGDSLIFKKDYDFESASAAAAVVLGRAADGPSVWKDESGKSIDELNEDLTDSGDL